jgi:hypothetical protein
MAPSGPAVTHSGNELEAGRGNSLARRSADAGEACIEAIRAPATRRRSGRCAAIEPPE